MSERPPGGGERFRRAPLMIALIGFLAVGGYFLWTEHRAHTITFLPFLLILACPLLHLFHHGSHGHDSHRHDGTGDDTARGGGQPNLGRHRDHQGGLDEKSKGDQR
jgi:hypothetical protein